MSSHPNSSSTRWMVAAAGRGPCRHHLDAAPHLAPVGGRRRRQHDQHRRRRAEVRHRFVAQQAERQGRIDRPQADVSAAHRGQRPRERPAVRMEHRERPQVARLARHRPVDERPDDVHVRVAMGDHHALRARRGAAGVVDGEQVVLVDRRRVEGGLFGRGERLVVEPPIPLPFQRHPVDEIRARLPHAVDRLQVVGMRADHLRAAVPDDVGDLVRGEPEVDGNEHRPDLRHGVERLELRVRVRRDVGHAVAPGHAEPLEGGRPAVAAREELRVGEPGRAVHDRLAIRIQGAGAAQELQRGEGRLHDGPG